MLNTFVTGPAKIGQVATNYVHPITQQDHTSIVKWDI